MAFPQLFFELVFGAKGRHFFTGLNCDPNLWNNDTQRVSGRDKTSAIINNDLDDILHRSRERFEEMKNSGKLFTLDEFVLKIKGTDEQLVTILDYLNKKVSELNSRVGVDITAATLQKYIR